MINVTINKSWYKDVTDCLCFLPAVHVCITEGCHG